MPGRLAVDFGTSNTVVAVWDEGAGEALTWRVPDYGEPAAGAGAEPVWLVPSLITYESQRIRWLGRQVAERQCLHAPGAFRWMKRYIANRSPLRRRVDGQEITPFQAGADFLSAVLTVAHTELGIGEDEVALTVPVEAYEHYQDWLGQAAEQAGIQRYRLIDEASAAAFGYGTATREGQVQLVFDFGGGTLDVAVVRLSAETGPGGRRGRVLGKAGAELGGTALDGWLFEHVLRVNGRADSDDTVRRLSHALLCDCERAKQTLSFQPRASIGVIDPDTGAVLGAALTREQFEALLDEHDALATIDRTVRRALNAARDSGYDESAVEAVLMIGGGSHIPCVQKLLQRMFGRERVHFARPFDAVACGAAAFVAGGDLCDHIQHDYAVRHVLPRTSEYGYQPLVAKGTPYPTTEPVRRLTIKATYEQQRQLGLAVFEVGESAHGDGATAALELVWDPSGAARLASPTADDLERRTYYWVNEHSPTFLTAEPPADKGEARFEVAFGIDANKRLLVTARDLRTGRLVLKDQPVVKLT